MNNVGIDIVENSRIKLSNEFVKKILHIDEEKILATFDNDKRKIEFLSGRWAVKEAIIKCIDKTIAMSKINIGYVNKKPIILNEDLNNISISISHESLFTVAIAINNG